MTTEREMESIITEALEHEDEECGTTSPVKRISTFRDCGILTQNKGLVVTMEDGTEFQVTIVQSR